MSMTKTEKTLPRCSVLDLITTDPKRLSEVKEQGQGGKALV
jgi:hypothetical protein